MSRKSDPHILAIDVLRSEIAAIAEDIAAESAIVPRSHARAPEENFIVQARQIGLLAEATALLRQRVRARR